MSHKYLSLQVNVYKYLSTSKRPRKQMTARKQHKQMSCQQITPRQKNPKKAKKTRQVIVRHSNRLVELLITWPGLFEAPSALLCNQCLLPQAVSKSQFKTKSKTCQPAFCLCGYSIQQISLREARTLFSPLTFPDHWLLCRWTLLLLLFWFFKRQISKKSKKSYVDTLPLRSYILIQTKVH